MLEKQNNVIFAVISNAFGIAMMLVITKAMTAYMTIEEYGEFRLIFNVASFLALFLILGRDSFILTISRSDLNKALSECTYGIITVFLGVTLLFMFSKEINSLVFDDKVSIKNYYLGTLMILFWGIYNMITPIFRIHGQQNLIFLFNNFLLRFIRLPFFFIFIFLGFASSSAYYSMIIGQGLLTILIIFMLFKKKLIQQFQLSLKNYFSNFIVSSSICVNILMFTVMTTIIITLVNKDFSMNFVGIVDMILMLTSLMMYPFMAYIKSIEPYLSKQYNPSKLNKNKKISFIICLLSCIFLILFSKNILWIFGESYESGYKALALTSILFFFSTLLGPYPEWLNLNGYSKYTSAILIISILCLISLYYLLLPLIGYYTAGLSLGISIIIYRFFTYIIYRNIINNKNNKFGLNYKYWLLSILVITASYILMLSFDLIYNSIFFIIISLISLKHTLVIINEKHI